MGANTKIEWAHHTFNIAEGCTKVSAGCANCYAEDRDARWHKANRHWGADKPRKLMSEAYWKKPIKWNKDAKESGFYPRVFCSSLCDVFEDHPTIDAQRKRLWELVGVTPYLNWLILTKRPERIVGSYPDHLGWTNHLWFGTSIEDQATADDRIRYLTDDKMGKVVHCKYKFLSVEPLLGPVDLSQHLLGIDWVIVGGESGRNARPMRPEWVRAIRDQCKAEQVPFFFKQWGEYAIDNSTWPPEHMKRVGKAVAGRRLDGKFYDEVPTYMDEDLPQ